MAQIAVYDSAYTDATAFKTAMSGVMLNPVNGLAYRDEIGQIDLEVGKLGVGKEQKNGTLSPS